jgi:hypothetical protein
MKKLLVFVFAASLSAAAAWYRHGDSAHAMGLVSVKGGRAHHPVQLAAGKERYTLVVTGTIIPPYRGDTRIEVDGEPEIPFAVHGSDPIIDLALRHRPSTHDRTLTGLQPKDRFTIWVVMTPEEPMPPGKRDIVFTDTVSGQRVLTIPVLFGETGEEAHHEH